MKKTGDRIAAAQLWRVMMKSHHAVRLIAEQSITNVGLCLTDFAALEALLHKGPLTISQIQEKVLLASGSMTAAIDRLEKRGLVVRKSTASDRRARIVQLTGEGKRLAAACFARHARDLEDLMSVLSAGERKQVYASLKKLGLFAARKSGGASHPMTDKNPVGQNDRPHGRSASSWANNRPRAASMP
jgi:MarR family transcriptional regulator, 2-MHQ and catechol-resistance regulon repressor